MQRQGILLLLCAALLCGCKALRPGEGRYVERGPGQQDVHMVSDGNAKMNAAMAEAQRTLPQFLQALQNPKPTQTGFLVKVQVKDAQHTEYMWLQGVAYDGRSLRGQLMDDPYEVKGYSKGQTLTVKPSETRDWIIRENGQMVGGYTEKVLQEMSGSR